MKKKKSFKRIFYETQEISTQLKQGEDRNRFSHSNGHPGRNNVIFVRHSVFNKLNRKIFVVIYQIILNFLFPPSHYSWCPFRFDAPLLRCQSTVFWAYDKRNTRSCTRTVTYCSRSGRIALLPWSLLSEIHKKLNSNQSCKLCAIP